jgi:hypothetical protein
MDSGYFSRVLERVKSKDFVQQFALWSSTAAVSYLIYCQFMANTSNNNQRLLEERLIQVYYEDNS